MGLMGEEEVRGRGMMVGGGVFFFFFLKNWWRSWEEGKSVDIDSHLRKLDLCFFFSKKRSLISVFFIKKKKKLDLCF